MNIQVSANTWFNTSSLLPHGKINFEWTNSTGDTKTDPILGGKIDVSTYVSINSSSAALRSVSSLIDAALADKGIGTNINTTA